MLVHKISSMFKFISNQRNENFKEKYTVFSPFGKI